MGYTLKFEHPHFPDDYEFAISGLGIVKNGSTVEIDEDQERMFVADRGQTLEDAFKNKEGIATISGSSTIPADELKALLPTPSPTTTETINEVVEEPNANADSGNSGSAVANDDSTTGPQETGGEM